MGPLKSTSRVTAATVVAWGAFVGTTALRAGGAQVSPRAAAVSAAAAAALALTCAIRAAGSIWRGPRLVSFACDGAVLCGPEESERIRSAAQLRGTMGGAGHLHRWRLLIRASAWFAAATVAGVTAVGSERSLTAAPLLGVAAATLATTLLPPRPFYYREANGGGVVVTPPCTPRRLGITGATSSVDSGVLRFG